MKIPGIPTKHNHRQYRSRLEARWACMFDNLGWKYEYEPYDLNGWIPDFVIYGTEEILVEVKPYCKSQEYDVEKLKNAIKGTDKEKADILLLGSTIFEMDHGGTHIGWLGDNDGKYCIFTLAKIVVWVPSIKEYSGPFFWGLHSAYSAGKNKDIIGGTEFPDIDEYNARYESVSEMWNEAGNEVQWKK